jgi:hypothetical protein
VFTLELPRGAAVGAAADGSTPTLDAPATGAARG